MCNVFQSGEGDQAWLYIPSVWLFLRIPLPLISLSPKETLETIPYCAVVLKTWWCFGLFAWCRLPVVFGSLGFLERTTLCSLVIWSGGDRSSRTRCLGWARRLILSTSHVYDFVVISSPSISQSFCPSLPPLGSPKPGLPEAFKLRVLTYRFCGARGLRYPLPSTDKEFPTYRGHSTYANFQ